MFVVNICDSGCITDVCILLPNACTSSRIRVYSAAPSRVPPATVRLVASVYCEHISVFESRSSWLIVELSPPPTQPGVRSSLHAAC